MSPLTLVLLAGDLVGLHGLLAAGANPNERDVDGAPALLVAARQEDPELVRALLAAGADPAVRADGGEHVSMTALHAAAGAGHEAVVAALLEGGADPSAARPASNAPAAAAACPTASPTGPCHPCRDERAPASRADQRHRQPASSTQ